MVFLVDNADPKISHAKIDPNIHPLSGITVPHHKGTHKYARAQA